MEGQKGIEDQSSPESIRVLDNSKIQSLDERNYLWDINIQLKSYSRRGKISLNLA